MSLILLCAVREWNGAWSDGAAEWTAEAREELRLKTGDTLVARDDGAFYLPWAAFTTIFSRLEMTQVFLHGAWFHKQQAAW